MSATQTTKVQKLVTADGTYATQSAFDSGTGYFLCELLIFFESTKSISDNRFVNDTLSYIPIAKLY